MRYLFSIAVLTITSGCGSNLTPLSPLTPAATQVLQGRVYPDGTTRLWVTAPQPGTVTLDLTSVDGSIALGLAFGVLVDGACGAERVAVRAGTIPQITETVNAGTFCVDVSDIGGVPLSGVAFSIDAHFQ
jgi:hypothetical protein